jgi:hypothetical protein
MKPEGWIARHPGQPPGAVKPLRVWLNADHGPRLLALSEVYELVWATTWGVEANTFVSPVLGLPELPVVEWPAPHDAGDAGADGVFWKTRHLVAHAGLPTGQLTASAAPRIDASRRCLRRSG